MINIVRAADTRSTATPAGTMTTLASPTLGPTGALSLWRVEMAAGATGPLHAFDSEQLWTVVSGRLSITVDGEAVELGAGDTLVLPTGVERQVSAVDAAQVIVCGHGDAVARVPGEATSRGTPAWIA